MRTTLTLDDDVAAMLQPCPVDRPAVQADRQRRDPQRPPAPSRGACGRFPWAGRRADQPSLSRESDDLGTGLDAQLGVRVRENTVRRRLTSTRSRC